MAGPRYAAHKQRAEQPSEEVAETESEFPKSTGGGWYELSDGSKVQGEDAAFQAEADLS